MAPAVEGELERIAVHHDDDLVAGVGDGTGSAAQGRAVQERQQVLSESLRVQDVGDVLLSGKDQPLYIG